MIINDLECRPAADLLSGLLNSALLATLLLHTGRQSGKNGNKVTAVASQHHGQIADVPAVLLTLDCVNLQGKLNYDATLYLGTFLVFSFAILNSGNFLQASSEFN